MNNAFDDFRTALYAQTNCKPQLASEKLNMYLLEKVRYIDQGLALVLNLVIRDIGNKQVRVGVLGFSDLNTGKEYLVTRAGFPHVQLENGRPQSVMPDGSLVFMGLDVPMTGMTAHEVLRRLIGCVTDLIAQHTAFEEMRREIEAQKERDRIAAHKNHIATLAQDTGCSAKRVEDIYALVDGSANEATIDELVRNIAVREGKLLTSLSRFGNELDEVARDIWQQTNASHLGRKCDKLVEELQRTIK